MPQRKRYTKELKLDEISLVREQGHIRAGASQSQDFNAKMLGCWVQEFNHDAG